MSSEQGYQLVIDCLLDDGSYKRLYLDTCQEKNVTASATIAQQPLQNGKTMSDHMWSNPDRYSISGYFSLYGNIHDEYDDFPGVTVYPDRLSNIQAVFEFIKDNGILCKLTTLDTNVDGSQRFKIRDSMALQNITWKEYQASMQYSLDFVEALAVDVNEEYGKIDDDIPNLYYPEARSLGAVLANDDNKNSDLVNRLILAALYEKGYLDGGDILYILNTSSINIGENDQFKYINDMLKGMVGGVGGKELITLGASLALLFIPGVGILASMVTLAVGMLLSISDLITSSQKTKEQKEKQKRVFHLVNNLNSYITTTAEGDIKLDLACIEDPNVQINAAEIERLYSLLCDVKDALLKLNDDCIVYSLSASEQDNRNREMVIAIEGYIYYVSFIFDKEAQIWKYKVCTEDIYGNATMKLDGSNGKLVNSTCVITDLNDAESSKCFFIDRSGQYKVYVYNPSLNPNVNNGTEEQNEIRKKLFSYQLLVCKDSIQTYLDEIKEAIVDKIGQLGYI